MRNYHALVMHSLRVQDWLQVSKGVLMSLLDSWAYFFVVAGWDEGHKHHIFSNISLDQEPRKQGCKGGSSTPWYFYGVERGGGWLILPAVPPGLSDWWAALSYPYTSKNTLTSQYGVPFIWVTTASVWGFREDAGWWISSLWKLKEQGKKQPVCVCVCVVPYFVFSQVSKTVHWPSVFLKRKLMH